MYHLESLHHLPLNLCLGSSAWVVESELTHGLALLPPQGGLSAVLTP
jgi:hypothetical protein